MTIKSLPHWPPTRDEVLAALDAAEAAWRLAKRSPAPQWRVERDGPHFRVVSEPSRNPLQLEGEP
jgi:hypothetical protein